MKVSFAEFMDKIAEITGCDNALPFLVKFPLKLALIGTGFAVLTEKLALLSPYRGSNLNDTVYITPPESGY
jgi:hypothetical protein